MFSRQLLNGEHEEDLGIGKQEALSMFDVMDRDAPPPPKVEAHEAAEVSSAQRDLQKLLGTLGATARGRLVADDYGAAPAEKLRRDWRAAKKAGEPYTVDNDPDFGYVDAELTETALYALDHIWIAKIPVVAHEDCPRDRAAGTRATSGLEDGAGGRFPPYDNLEGEPYKSRVDYAQLESEEDPLWHPEKREGKRAICKRARAQAAWLGQRPETRVAVAAHSGFLLALFNAVLDLPDDARGWFGTGECRAVALTFAT
ncbi:histidine phosphatase superfamily protein [Aureococcus anophagefferens]|uniref:Histidine phosphatase superfamily protein n=1 Tax=Aureococcus anophagefferens TaxID=44056 RepID=A0ABR1GDG5_AURAN